VQYWCEYAWLGGASADAGVVIEVEGDRIVGVASGVPVAPAHATALRGITLPGFANSHSHAFHRALRGGAQPRGSGSFWTWREEMYALAERLDPDSYRELARAVYAEMACAGITVVGEFHYLHHDRDGTPYADPNVMSSALIAAAQEAGIRIALLDTCYLHGGLVDGRVEEPAGVQRRFADRDADAWAARLEALAPLADAATRIGAAIHSVRAVDLDAQATLVAWARAHDAPIHAHVSEQPAENDACLAAYGRTPTAVLADAGALDGPFTAVHATHLTDEDIARLGAAHASCCFCPTTERDLADGIGPAGRLRAAGATLTIGTDSHAVIDPFEEARAIELDERLVSGVRGTHDAAALLTAATAAGYDSLGWPGGGRIAAGAPADFVTVDLDSVRLAGAPRDRLLDSVVFAAGAPDVRQVVVGGSVIVRDGRHVKIDVEQELASAIAAVRG
jgi:formiminoglutamate deiminase